MTLLRGNNLIQQADNSCFNVLDFFWPSAAGKIEKVYDDPVFSGSYVTATLRSHTMHRVRSSANGDPVAVSVAPPR